MLFSAALPPPPLPMLTEPEPKEELPLFGGRGSCLRLRLLDLTVLRLDPLL